MFGLSIVVQGVWFALRQRVRSGQLLQLGKPLSPETAGAAVVDLVRADTATVTPAYLLTGAGLKQLA